MSTASRIDRSFVRSFVAAAFPATTLDCHKNSREQGRSAPRSMLQVACIVERSCVEGSLWRRVACGMWQAGRQHVTHIYFWHWYFSRSYFQVIFSLLLLLLRFYSAFAFIFFGTHRNGKNFSRKCRPRLVVVIVRGTARGAPRVVCV